MSRFQSFSSSPVGLANVLCDGFIEDSPEGIAKIHPANSASLAGFLFSRTMPGRSIAARRPPEEKTIDTQSAAGGHAAAFRLSPGPCVAIQSFNCPKL